MYQTDLSFENARKRDTIEPRLRGTIDGVSFTHKNILQGTFRLENKCVDPEKIGLGGVFIGELRATLLPSIARTRGGWNGKEILCEYGLHYGGEDHYIPCPSGVYRIHEALWVAEGLEVVAYDNMSKFDREYLNEQSSGQAYDWLQFFCRRCEVELGMTREEVERLPNGKEFFEIYDAGGLETYRDALSFMAAALCSFATIDRQGHLVLRTFKSEIDEEINETRRFVGGSFSDFQTSYTALSVVDMATGRVDKLGTRKDAFELVVELGENPFLQLGFKDTKYRMQKAILAGLENFKYTPFETTMLGCCVYDLGDVVRFTGGIAQDVTACVMMYDFGLDDYCFYGFGDNPALVGAHNFTEKRLTGVNSSIENKALGIVTTTNVSEFDLGTEWQTIGKMRFSVANSQTVLFHGVSKFDLDNSGLVQFRYRVNSDVVDFIHELQMPTGTDTATLFIPFPATGGIPTDFEVQVRSSNATGTVQPLDLRGAIVGTGIDANVWDGLIQLEDKFGRITRHRGIRNITETEIRFTKRTPIKASVEDLFERIIREDRVKILDDDYRITMKINEYTRIEEDEDEVTRITEDGIIRTTIGGFALDGN